MLSCDMSASTDRNSSFKGLSYKLAPIQARIDAIRYAAENDELVQSQIDAVVNGTLNALNKLMSEMGTSFEQINKERLKKCIDNMSDSEMERYRMNMF